MATYIAPEELKVGILNALQLAGYTTLEHIITFDDAWKIVHEACYDKCLEQPAVKLAGFYLEYVYSAWFGEVLHCHGPFTGADKPDPGSSSFLFHKGMRDPWIYVEFALPLQA